MGATEAVVIRQHLIDPEICIRCNTCESTCPVGAITHDARNYVVDASICNLCMACVPPCPTGSIDNWRSMPRAQAYSTEAQFGWDALPAELSADELGGADASEEALAAAAAPQAEPNGASEEAAFDVGAYAAVIPPWSAASPYANLYGPKAATRSVSATVVGNVRVTEAGTDYDTASHRARFRRDAVSSARRAVDRHTSLPAQMRTDERITRANIRSRARATASGRATITSRSP